MTLCTYCGCKNEATEGINNWPYCSIHHQMLINRPIVDKVRGHVSRYNPEAEIDFDMINEIKLTKSERHNSTEWEESGFNKHGEE